MRTFRILCVIVFAQFCCTSLWFAGNGVMPELAATFHLNMNAVGLLTSAVQLGFISGTLSFAILSLADRFSPSRVFFICALLAGGMNIGLIMDFNTLSSLIGFRFLTGFFLAGIYPVGMKISADYFQKGLGVTLGFLVGALVLGTALPHILRDQMSGVHWSSVIKTVSSLSLFGGMILVVFVPDGPYRKTAGRIHLSAFTTVFRKREFRKAAFGYFGHMWELYAFWTFVPLIIQLYNENRQNVELSVSFWSFMIIGVGAFSCVIGGYLSKRWGERLIAYSALFMSGCCCLLVPWVFLSAGPYAFIVFLLLWGAFVVADSPLFSTLVAHNAIDELKGTALTIVNCLGFTITIVSIQLISYLYENTGSMMVLMFLALGPIAGILQQGISKKE